MKYQALVAALLLGCCADSVMAQMPSARYGGISTEPSHTTLPRRAPYIARKVVEPKKVDPVVLKTIWRVDAQVANNVHLGCTASTKPDSNGVELSIYVPISVKDSVVVSFSGVAFNAPSDSSTLGLLQVDDEMPFEVYGRSIAPWQSQIVVTQHPNDPQDVLHQLAKGRKISLLLGNLRYTTDLTGSKDALAAVARCNADGQAEVNRKRIAEAQKAKTR